MIRTTLALVSIGLAMATDHTWIQDTTTRNNLSSLLQSMLEKCNLATTLSTSLKGLSNQYDICTSANACSALVTQIEAVYDKLALALSDCSTATDAYKAINPV